MLNDNKYKEKNLAYGEKALIEGVLMRGKEGYAFTVKTPDDTFYKEKTESDKVKNLNTFDDKTWLTISDFPIDNDIRYLNNRSVIIYQNFDSDIDRYNNYQCHTPECDIFKNPFKSFNILI